MAVRTAQLLLRDACLEWILAQECAGYTASASLVSLETYLTVVWKATM